MSRDAVAAILQDYPRIYFACHRRHRHDEKTGVTLSQHQASVLDHLDPIAELSMSALADHMGVTIGTMSVHIDRLEGLGYVKRTPDANDKRRVCLRLTAAGNRMRTRDSVLDPALVEALLKELTPTEREHALAGLSLLARAAVRATKARGPRGRFDAA